LTVIPFVKTRFNGNSPTVTQTNIDPSIRDEHTSERVESPNQSSTFFEYLLR